MAAVGLHSAPATLRDFGAHTNFANLGAPPNPNTDEYEVNPLLLKILHTRKIFTGEDGVTILTLMLIISLICVKIFLVCSILSNKGLTSYSSVFGFGGALRLAKLVCAPKSLSVAGADCCPTAAIVCLEPENN